MHTANTALLFVANLHQPSNHFDLSTGVGCFQWWDSGGCTRICSDCHREMCIALAYSIPPRSHGELDRLHVNPNGNWLKLIG
jgi:hypothetical protein